VTTNLPEVRRALATRSVSNRPGNGRLRHGGNREHHFPTTYAHPLCVGRRLWPLRSAPDAQGALAVSTEAEFSDADSTIAKYHQ